MYTRTLISTCWFGYVSLHILQCVEQTAEAYCIAELQKPHVSNEQLKSFSCRALTTISADICICYRLWPSKRTNFVCADGRSTELCRRLCETTQNALVKSVAEQYTRQACSTVTMHMQKHMACEDLQKPTHHNPWVMSRKDVSKSPIGVAWLTQLWLAILACRLCPVTAPDYHWWLGCFHPTGDRGLLWFLASVHWHNALPVS